MAVIDLIPVTEDTSDLFYESLVATEGIDGVKPTTDGLQLQKIYTALGDICAQGDRAIIHSRPELSVDDLREIIPTLSSCDLDHIQFGVFLLIPDGNAFSCYSFGDEHTEHD